MLKYVQKSGCLYDALGRLMGVGYSGGHCGCSPEGVNNPDMQDIPNVGPIPVGLYTMQTPIQHSVLGEFAIPLEPDPGNAMHNRSGFFAHGDLISGPPNSASDGCIVISREIREKMWTSYDRVVKVISGTVR